MRFEFLAWKTEWLMVISAGLGILIKVALSVYKIEADN
jgi:hypothetical protein